MKKDHVYFITPLGLFGEALVAKVIKNMAVQRCNAIVLNSRGELEFVMVEAVEAE